MEDSRRKYNYYKKSNLFHLFLQGVRTNGLINTFFRATNFIKDKFVSEFLFLKKTKYFILANEKIPYFYHKYNKTWKNERAIEIPIFLNYLRRNQPKKVLEVGNTLAHYRKIHHQVVDKYEIGNNIINEDIETFLPQSKYDLIFSISTMEHVRLDDFPKDAEKAARSVKRVVNNLLIKDGRLFISFPTNYNPSLMSLVNKSKGIRLMCFKRVDKRRNIWREVNFEDIKDIVSENAEAIIFSEFTKKSNIKF